MAASYPKPDEAKVNRVAPKFGWVDLPAAGRSGATPKLPSWRKWHAGTARWWKELWATPQATQWEASGRTLWTLACLYDDMIAGRADVAKVSAEMRQHEDRHGLNPKSMLQLRWRIVEQPDAEVIDAGSKRRSRYDHLKVIADAVEGA